MANPPQQSQPKKGITWKRIKVFFALVLIFLVILIIAKNARPVEFWLFKKFEHTSLIVLMLISLLLGGLLAWILLSVSRKHNETTRLRNEVKRLQEELRKTGHRPEPR